LARCRCADLCRALLLLALPIVSSSCATSPFHEGNRFETTVMANLAWRCADNDLEPVDEQRALGLEADVRLPNADTGLELGLFHSRRDGTRDSGTVDVEASMTELSAGGRWEYGDWLFGSRPYASAGAALLFVSTESDGPGGASQSATDWTVGPYIRFGLEWPVTERLSIALDYRQVMFTQAFRDLRLDEISTDANYSQGGIVLSWRF
jgi:opacity protein-like surface antigen